MKLEWRDPYGLMNGCYLTHYLEGYVVDSYKRDTEADYKYLVNTLGSIHPEYLRLMDRGIDITFGKEFIMSNPYKIFFILRGMFKLLIEVDEVKDYLTHRQYKFKDFIKCIRTLEYRMVYSNMTEAEIAEAVEKDAIEILKRYYSMYNIPKNERILLKED